MNVTIISPTTLQLSWSPLRTQGIVNTWGLQVSYQVHDNKTDSILVDKHQAEVNISQLRPDTTYTIWVVPVTSRGFGFSSQVLNVTTPYRGNFYVFLDYLENKGDFPRSVRSEQNILKPEFGTKSSKFTKLIAPYLEISLSLMISCLT